MGWTRRRLAAAAALQWRKLLPNTAQRGPHAPGSTPLIARQKRQHKRRMAVRQSMFWATRLSLQVLAWAAAVVFVGFAFWRPTEGYRTSQILAHIAASMAVPFPGNESEETKMALHEGKEGGKSGAPLWGGGSVFAVTVQWGTVLIAALCMAGLKAMNLMWPQLAQAQPVNQKTTLADSYAWRKVREVTKYPLPPRPLWDWWCGGLTVLDAFLVCLWLGLASCYLWSTIHKQLLRVAGQMVDHDRPASPTNMELWLMAVGKATGESLRGLVMLIFFPVSRSSFLKWLTGQEFSTLIKYHRWLSYGTLSVSTWHGVMFFLLWSGDGILFEKLAWKGNMGFTGLVILLAFLVMACTSSPWFRRTYYWLFLRVHILGFVIFLVFLSFHDKGMAIWIMPGLILYFLDRAFRFWQTAGNWTRVHAGDFRVEDGVVSLGLTWADKPGALPIMPGQTIYLRVPRLAPFQSHPFSVADVLRDDSAPGVTCVTLHFPVAGNWSRGFERLTQSERPIFVQAEGPYETALGSSTLSRVVVMVGGGAGATPLLGLLHHWHRLGSSTRCTLPDHSGLFASRPHKCYLVWSARSLGVLRLLGADLLCSASTAMPSGGLQEEHVALMAADSNSEMLTEYPGWLHMALHYTGPQQEDNTAQAQLADSQSVSISSRAWGGLHGTTPWVLTPSPASFPLMYAICTLLCVLGAAAGQLAAQYNIGRIARTRAVGLNSYLNGGSQLLLMTVGAIVLPLIALAVSAAGNYWVQTRRGSRAVADLGYTKVAGQGDGEWSRQKLAGQPVAIDQAEAVGVMRRTWGAYMASNALTVLPGYVLASATSTSGGLELQRGRPNMRSMLRGVQAEHLDVAEVTVLVGGPECLWLQVRELCTELSPLVMGPCAGQARQPLLVPVRVAHQH